MDCRAQLSMGKWLDRAGFIVIHNITRRFKNLRGFTLCKYPTNAFGSSMVFRADHA